MCKLGIYGGSFSPPHLGHYRALSAFIEQETPDETLVIPTLVPPHKELCGDASPEERLDMCRLAFRDLPITVDPREIHRGGKSYTVLTLEELKNEENRLLFLCGTDMFLTLDAWYRPERIFALAEIVYIQREDGEAGVKANRALCEKAEEYRRRFGATVRELRAPVTEISSSELRDALERGEPVSDFLHPDVEEYIKRCRLYNT